MQTDLFKIKTYYTTNRELIIQTDRNGLFLSQIFPIIFILIWMIFVTIFFIICIRENWEGFLVLVSLFFIFGFTHVIYMVDAIFEYQKLTITQNGSL